MATERESLPLPDFQGAARCIEALAVEVGRCENIPVFREERRFDEALQRQRELDWQRQQFDWQRQQLETQTAISSFTLALLTQTTQQMHQRLDCLFDIIIATRANSAARVINSMLTNRDPTSRLAAFVNTNTNRPIMGFPATFRDLQEMNEDNLDQMLLDLGLEVRGDIQTKRKKFGIIIGIHHGLLGIRSLDIDFPI